MTTPKPMRTLRQEFREELAKVGRQLDGWLKAARIPETPQARELAVREGQRAVGHLAAKVRKLAEVGEPEPWITAPTRERSAKAGGPPAREVVSDAEGKPAGVNFRWHWPVEAAHRRHITTARQYMGAARVRRAFFDAGGRPSVALWGDEGRASDPARRTPMTPRQQKAHREFFEVWRRLEPELQAVVWVLVLEQPLPGDAEALTVADFGRRISRSSTEEHARWFAWGALKMTLVRLSTIYAILDKGAQKAAADAEIRAEAERQLHRQRVPQSTLRNRST